jgi:hypothetical protein
VGRGIIDGPTHWTTNPGDLQPGCLKVGVNEGRLDSGQHQTSEKTYVDNQSSRSRRFGFSRRPAALAPPADPRLLPGLHRYAACMRLIQSASPPRIRPSTSRSFSFAIFLVYRLQATIEMLFFLTNPIFIFAILISESAILCQSAILCKSEVHY